MLPEVGSKTNTFLLYLRRIFPSYILTTTSALSLSFLCRTASLRKFLMHLREIIHYFYFVSLHTALPSVTRLITYHARQAKRGGNRQWEWLEWFPPLSLTLSNMWGQLALHRNGLQRDTFFYFYTFQSLSYFYSGKECVSFCHLWLLRTKPPYTTWLILTYVYTSAAQLLLIRLYFYLSELWLMRAILPPLLLFTATRCFSVTTRMWYHERFSIWALHWRLFVKSSWGGGDTPVKMTHF